MGCKQSTVKVHPDDAQNNNTNKREEVKEENKEECESDVSCRVTKTVVAANYNESRISAMNNAPKDKVRNSALQLTPNDKKSSVNKMGQSQCIESALYKRSYDEQDREVVNQ